MRRTLSIALGAMALATTASVMGIHVVLAVHMPQESSGRTTSKVSAVLEAVVFVSLGWLLASYASLSLRELSMGCLGVVFGLSLFAITFAATASVATIIYLSHLTIDLNDQVLGTNQNDFLIGSSVCLGLSFAFQLIFVVVHFVLARASFPQALSLHSLEDERQLPAFKSKPSRTTPEPLQTREMTSMDSRSPPSSLGGRSTAETITTIKVSLSNVIRPVTSKTQLLSTKENKRPASLDLMAYRTSGEDSFDTWDTSSVDTHNRQAVFEASSPPHAKHHFLEPIPGSPTVSRESSPSNEMPFEPPKLRTRSRSYSPVPSKRDQPSFTQHPSTSELHIHPLFRSDSPTPPPIATPGTVVLAAPNAGQVITHRHSLRTLNLPRSATAPAGPSPLGNRPSIDFNKKPRDDQSSLEEVAEEEPATEERTMTPPIPDWVMGAGPRSSLTGYNSRKSQG
ncbi:Fc.00g111350.m01.CDS01 [Cosmosporella sp. VM-42]